MVDYIAGHFAAVAEKVRAVAAQARPRALVIGLDPPPPSADPGRFNATYLARAEDLEALASAGDRDRFDLILVWTRTETQEEAMLWGLRARYPDALLGAWSQENHHHLTQNLRTVLAADLIFPGHWVHHAYLATVQSIVACHVPACTLQFGSAFVRRTFPDGLPARRRDPLFGGFYAWPFAAKRNRFVEQVAQHIPRSAVTLNYDPGAFVARPREERLHEWCGYKVGLVVPVNRDLSCRVFECLLTGQIPLLAQDVPDLDAVIPPALQAELPIVRYVDGSVESVREGYARALARYDAEGAQGVLRRHEYARRYHEVDSRVRRVSQFIERFDEIRIATGDDGALRAYAVERAAGETA